eukprot:14181144-Alexandrium_andersonii.AAC.1
MPGQSHTGCAAFSCPFWGCARTNTAPSGAKCLFSSRFSCTRRLCEMTRLRRALPANAKRRRACARTSGRG